MAKCSKGMKSGNGKSVEFHGRGPGPKGQASAPVGGGMKKGDSRSKSRVAPISPQKGY